jgi:osmotically-inducible protein OsmY
MVRIMLIALVAVFAQAAVFAQLGRPEPTRPSLASPTKVVPTPAAAPAAKAVVEDASNTAKSEAKDAKKDVKGAKQETKNSASSAAMALDDDAIEKAIKARFASLPSLKDNSTLGVSVSGGVVTLTGVVKNPGTKGVATKAAKKVSGVKKINNEIVIRENP